MANAALNCYIVALTVIACQCVQATSRHQQDIFDQLSIEELKETFGTADHNADGTELVFPRTESDANGILMAVKIPINQSYRRIELVSVDDQLISPHLVTISHDKISRITTGLPTKPCHFQAKKASLQQAAISNCDGTLKGIVTVEGVHYVLHPLPKRLSNDHRIKRKRNLSHPHVLYKRSSPGNVDFCGVKTPAPIQSALRDSPDLSDDSDDKITTKIMSSGDPLIVDTAIFVDYEMFNKYQQKFGSAADSYLQDFVLTVINNVQFMYHQSNLSPGIHFKVVRYEVFKSQPTELDGSRHSYGDALPYLDLFCPYQRDKANRNWDHSILITGYDLHRNGDTSISGISRLNGVCDPYNSCTMGEGADFSAPFIFTHELGHSFGMKHDEPYCNSAYIMSTSLGPGKTSWSTCSQKYLEKFVDSLIQNDRNCLALSSSAAAVVPIDELPGQKFTADQQCELINGPGFKQQNPREENQHPQGVCYVMWCGPSPVGRIVTSHPALEGTYCAPGRYCLHGQCVPWSDEFHLPKIVDGGWTSWSTVSNCLSCQCPPYSGGIGVLPSIRSCNSPSPLNGGSECGGGAVRGIVCAQKCLPETNPNRTLQTYLNGVCGKIKVTQNNNELTGVGSQLTKFPKRACKVFCNVRSSSSGSANYRFFGDLLPDGTACGLSEEKYCVSGECLPFACDKLALVRTDLECPTGSSTCQASFPYNNIGSWSNWANWSACSTTCGSGERTRSRTCSNDHCADSPTEKETCKDGECPQWSGWSSWSYCSVSCGSGVQTRTRACYGRGNCIGSTDDSTSCINPNC